MSRQWPLARARSARAPAVAARRVVAQRNDRLGVADGLRTACPEGWGGEDLRVR